MPSSRPVARPVGIPVGEESVGAGSVGAGERPLRRDAAANRRRVLQAATRVFATHGLDAPVEEIAVSAGVGMGTLYRRFPTKEALIEELARNLCQELLDAARRAADEPGPDGLEQYLRDAGEVLEAHGSCMSRLWNGAVTPDLLAELDRLVGSLLDAAKAGGRLRADASTTDVTVLFWAIRGIVETAVDAAPGAWKRHLDVVLAGLRPGSDPIDHPPLSLDQRRAARARLMPDT